MVVIADRYRGALSAACAGSATPVTSGSDEVDCNGNVRTAVTLNDFGEPQAIDTWWTGGGELDFALGYDLAGRIDTITEVVDGAAEARQYHYDPQGRLEAVTNPNAGGATVYAYEYDDNGNRIGWVTPTSTCKASSGACAVYDEQDRMRQYAGVDYTYDDNGTLLLRDDAGEQTSYEYDVQGNLRHVAFADGGAVDYLIDGVGRRVGRAVDGNWNRFWIYKDGLNPIAQLDENGDLEMLFIYALQPHVPSMVVVLTGAHAGTYRVVTDQVGSVRRLVNIDTGAVELAVDYSPFGEIISEGGDLLQRFPFRFAGGLWDEATGLIRFGARDYDPRVGRWTAKDPLLFTGSAAGGLYEYSGSSPASNADPNGKLFSSCTTPSGAPLCSLGLGGIATTSTAAPALPIAAGVAGAGLTAAACDELTSSIGVDDILHMSEPYRTPSRPKEEDIPKESDGPCSAVGLSPAGMCTYVCAGSETGGPMTVEMDCGGQCPEIYAGQTFAEKGCDDPHIGQFDI